MTICDGGGVEGHAKIASAGNPLGYSGSDTQAALGQGHQCELGISPKAEVLQALAHPRSRYRIRPSVTLFHPMSRVQWKPHRDLGIGPYGSEGIPVPTVVNRRTHFITLPPTTMCPSRLSQRGGMLPVVVGGFAHCIEVS